MKYCLTHEEWVYFESRWMDSDGCIFTSCPAPEFDMSDEWVDSLVDPSEDELILMDMSADVLLSDFGII